MHSPEDPRILSGDPRDLLRWIERRCTKLTDKKEFWHFREGDVSITLSSDRSAFLACGDRHISIEHDKRNYRGRYWKSHFSHDIRNAIYKLQNGGGRLRLRTYGEKIRKELGRRSNGERPPIEERNTDWLDWLEDDELRLFLGCWLHEAAYARGIYEVTRCDRDGLRPTNSEFKLAFEVARPRNLYWILHRLARERMVAAGVEGVHKNPTYGSKHLTV